MFSPWFPPRLNFTGIALPALATLSSRQVVDRLEEPAEGILDGVLALERGDDVPVGVERL